MSKYRSSGTLFKRGDGGSTETFTEITQAMDIDGPGTETDFEETTTHTDAAASNFKAWSPLMRDGGEIKTEVLWDPNNVAHQGLDSDQATSRLGNYQVVFPTSPVKTANFAGYVKDFSFKAPVKGMLKRNLSVKITGPVTFT
jgi:hypothetical protein